MSFSYSEQLIIAAGGHSTKLWPPAAEKSFYTTHLLGRHDSARSDFCCELLTKHFAKEVVQKSL